MKRLILAVLIAVIGFAPSQQVLADPNQGVQLLEQVGAGIAGAAIGYNGAKAAGANQPWSVAGGVLGAEIGVSIAQGYRQPHRRPRYREQSQHRYGYDGGGYGYGNCNSRYGDDEDLNRECQLGAARRAADNRREELRAARDYGGGGYSTSAW